MSNRISAEVGCEFPLFAFSHCRDVVAAVSRAGGFGVLGASGCTPDELEIELAWIDAHAGGKPYGVDLLIPEVPSHDSPSESTVEDLKSSVSPAHRKFVVELLKRHNVLVTEADVIRDELPPFLSEFSEELMDVAFRHPIKLIASALGIAPLSMILRAKAHGIPVAALIGTKEQALRQVAAGVDIIVAQGTEAGGHCGEVSTLVLVPEVVRALKTVGEVPVLAAGGIMTGAQMAGCMAMGAEGVWTGSVWLATKESEVSEAFRSKMIQARSRDTTRSRSRTGKPARQLRSAWHDAWDGDGSPEALPMPLMAMISQPAFQKIDRSVETGNERALPLVSYFVGQGVGLVESVRAVSDVVREFKEEFADSFLALQEKFEDLS